MGRSVPSEGIQKKIALIGDISGPTLASSFYIQMKKKKVGIRRKSKALIHDKAHKLKSFLLEYYCRFIEGSKLKCSTNPQFHKTVVVVNKSLILSHIGKNFYLCAELICWRMK